VTHLSTFGRRINVDKKYWEGTCPAEFFFFSTEKIYTFMSEKKKSSQAKRLDGI